MATEDGLPLGVQLVGRRDNDARLLRTARWLVKTLGRGATPGGRKAAPAQCAAHQEGTIAMITH